MKEKIKNIFSAVLKIAIYTEYILGFIPTLLINYFFDLFKKPSNDREFYKRILYIQVFVFPSIIAGLMVFLEIWSQSLIIAGLMNFISLLYILGIVYFQYKNDDYIKFVCGGDKQKIAKLKKRLILIKCVVFFFAFLIIGFFLPHHYISFMID